MLLIMKRVLAGATTTRFLESLPFTPSVVEVVDAGMGTTVQATTSPVSLLLPSWTLLCKLSNMFRTHIEEASIVTAAGNITFQGQATKSQS